MNAADPVVPLIGPPVEYADGAERAVLEILRGASDRSAMSDELTAHISSEGTRYHLSRRRTNILRPIRFRSGMRVLDCGAGTGVLLRYLAERGAQVVGIEGSRERATAAALRCRGIEGVEVLAGTIDAYSDARGFDAVICIGVYEYVAGRGPESGAAFLRHLRRLTRPGGVLVLAIENQIGLKYLAGYPEDHVATPGAGIGGYSPSSHVRTFVRRTLASQLARAGFTAQQWLFPFPDYKYPTTVLSGLAYEHEPDAEHLVDLLVRWPSAADVDAGYRLADDRGMQRVLVEAGLGPDVANSFLLVAGDDTTALARFVSPRVAAWHFGTDRLARFSTEKRIRHRRQGRGRSIAARRVSNERPVNEWLSLVSRARRPFVEGATLEQLALGACAEGTDALRRVLVKWRDTLAAREVPPRADAAGHPFRRATIARELPPDHIDVVLSNFVVTTDGAIAYVDDEWCAPSGVDADLVCCRALWWLAADLVRRGISHPWGAETTIEQLTANLSVLCRVPDDADLRRHALEAEAQFQVLVNGGHRDAMLDVLQRLGQTSQATHAPRVPIAALWTRANAAERTILETRGAAALLHDAYRVHAAQEARRAARLAPRGVTPSARGEHMTVRDVLALAREQAGRRDGGLSGGAARLVAGWLNRGDRDAYLAARTASITASGLFDLHAYERETGRTFDEESGPVHYLLIGQWSGLSPHVLFDPQWWSTQRPRAFAEHGTDLTPVEAYATGGAEAASPHLLFDAAFYLEHSPDAAPAGLPPLLHYLRQGSFDGRWPHPLFDPVYYRARNPETAAGGVDPLVHFVTTGAAAGSSPSAFFDVPYYMGRYAEVAAAGRNALVDYLIEGARAGRDPNAWFCTSAYLARYPDVRAAGVNPLVHYVRFGRLEGRVATPPSGRLLRRGLLSICLEAAMLDAGAVAGRPLRVRGRVRHDHGRIVEVRVVSSDAEIETTTPPDDNVWPPGPVDHDPPSWAFDASLRFATPGQHNVFLDVLLQDGTLVDAGVIASVHVS